MARSPWIRFDVDPRTGIASARVDPQSFIADSDPQFEEILAADPMDLDLEVRGDPELFEPPEQGLEIAVDPDRPAGVGS
jgi:hypothetical protein